MFGVSTFLGFRPRSVLRHAPICSVSKPLSVGVIGGGMAGVTAARFLAEGGVAVVLHEREPQLGGRLGTVAGRSARHRFEPHHSAGNHPTISLAPHTHPARWRTQRSAPAALTSRPSTPTSWSRLQPLFHRLTASVTCGYTPALTHPAFVEQLERWEREGLVAEWHGANPHVVTAPGEWAPLPSGDAGKALALASPALACFGQSTLLPGAWGLGPGAWGLGALPEPGSVA